MYCTEVDMAFDALTATGIILLVMIIGLLFFMCSRDGITCNDRSRHDDEGERELARRKRL
jgi:hypothetical protein